jgi:hypothetical protein
MIAKYFLFLCTEDDWSTARLLSKGDDYRLCMVCCNAPTVAKHSSLDLRFFSHKPSFDPGASCSESIEHESLKEVAANAVKDCTGWNADVEVSGEGWSADVLATRGSVKIAIEIQLSSQAKRETKARNDRFVSTVVTPFWLKGQRKHLNNFGDGLQQCVKGTNIQEKMTSVKAIITELVAKVARQVNLANALAKLIKDIPGWKYSIKRQGTVPTCFELIKDGNKQQIVLGELGPSLLPTVFRQKITKLLVRINSRGQSYSLEPKLPI